MDVAWLSWFLPSPTRQLHASGKQHHLGGTGYPKDHKHFQSNPPVDALVHTTFQAMRTTAVSNFWPHYPLKSHETSDYARRSRLQRFVSTVLLSNLWSSIISSHFPKLLAFHVSTVKLSEAFLFDEGIEHIESLPKWWTAARIPSESSDPAPDQPEGTTTGRIPWRDHDEKAGKVKNRRISNDEAWTVDNVNLAWNMDLMKRSL